MATGTKNDGILAIWHDVDDAIGDDYERWYFTEHLPERLAVPGFVAGRRYEALAGEPRFLTYYEGEEPGVFRSPAYLARLGDPTPLTTRVLRHFRNTNRTVCRRVEAWGETRGAWAVVARIDRTSDSGRPAALSALREQGGAWREGWNVLRSELWEAIPLPPAEPTAESKLRGAPDRYIDAALLAHLAREADAQELAGRIDSGATVGVYRLLCELRSD